MEQKQRNPHDVRATRVKQMDICIDCVVLSVNGEETSPEHMEAFAEAGMSILNVHTDTDPHFSWSPCNFCNSPLGGNRYEADILISKV